MEHVAIGLWALIFVVALVRLSMPGDGAARAALRRWAPDLDATPTRIAVVRRQLIRQRLPLAVLVLALCWGPPLHGALVGSRDVDVVAWLLSISWYLLVGCLVVSALLAEALATLARPRGPVRAASLRPRRAADLVPRPGLVAFAALASIVLAVAIAAVARLRDLSSPSRIDEESLPLRKAAALHGRPYAWAALIGVLVTVALVAWTVRLATRRPAISDDAELDAALRVRSARVALGLGLAMTGLLAVMSCEALRAAATLLDGPGSGSFWADLGDLVGATLALAGLVGWFVVAHPPWRWPRGIEIAPSRATR